MVWSVFDFRSLNPLDVHPTSSHFTSVALWLEFLTRNYTALLCIQSNNALTVSEFHEGKSLGCRVKVFLYHSRCLNETWWAVY